MSTKTVTKRVALATVVALGAGVLSLVSVTSATAASNNVITGATNPALGINTLNIANLQTTTGAGALISANTVANAKSFGLLAISDLAGGTTAGLTQTATLLSNGTLSVYESVSGVQYDAITVTGGYISSTDSNASLNGTQTAAIDSPTVAAYSWGSLIKPNAGVSSMTVQLWTNLASTTATPSSGTLSGQITVNIATASVSGAVSQSKSGIYYLGNSGSYAAGTSGVTSDTTTGTPGTSAYNVPQIADIRIRDAYSVAVSTGLVTATATNGAYVALTAAATMASTGPQATASSTSAPYITAGDNVGLTVAPSVVGASSTTVTITYNGVVVGTKSFTFTGNVAKVVLSAGGIATTNANQTIASSNYKGSTFAIKFLDSAGNQVYPVSGSTAYPTNLAKSAGFAGSLGLNFTTGNTYYPAAASATGFVTCGNVNATGAVVLDYTNADGSVITSNSLAVACAGNAYTYTAKLDKAKYAPGDIATLSVTFKDSTGALASDETGTIAANADSSAPSIYAGSALLLTGGSSATTAGSKTDSTTKGVATYTFIVGNTSGTYALNVDFSHVDAISGQSAVQVPFTIADGSTSLNDVLKGIVSLIASINKQIAALAKLVTKK
jgi:hypothetical protein